MEKGYVHIYTGNGKGKTTAALGLTLRACGAGKNILFAQFLKQEKHSEHVMLRKMAENVTVRCFGSGVFVGNRALPEERLSAQAGIEEIAGMLSQKPFDVIILDEVLVAVDLQLIDCEAILEIIRIRPPHTELVLTGRNAPQVLMDAADLVTEMREIKHYYQKGITARKGIER